MAQPNDARFLTRERGELGGGAQGLGELVLREADDRDAIVVKLRENGTFLSFPYVCPEPVLVKC
jgi:hypothetical protein